MVMVLVVLAAMATIVERCCLLMMIAGDDGDDDVGGHDCEDDGDDVGGDSGRGEDGLLRRTLPAPVRGSLTFRCCCARPKVKGSSAVEVSGVTTSGSKMHG